MRKSQSVRYNARPSMNLGVVDDLGVLREAEDTAEDTLRRQLLEKERECDRLIMSNENYKAQLDQRPPLEAYQKIQREYKNLDLLLQGTQRENEKCMADLERVKAREKLLERELTRLAGDNWQVNLEIPPPPSIPTRSSTLHQRSNTISSPISHMISRTHNSSPTPSLDSGSYSGRAASPSVRPANKDASGSDASMRNEMEAQRLAQIEQIRMLILGLDQKFDARQGRLGEIMERAEAEGRMFDSKVAQAQKAGVSFS